MATDQELTELAQDAVDPLNGGQYGQPLSNNSVPGVTQGLDLSAYNTPAQPTPPQLAENVPPDVTAPNGPVDNGPVEVPGDRDMSTVATPTQAGPTGGPGPSVPPAPTDPARALVTARTADMAQADAKLAETPARVEQAQNDAAAQDVVAQEARNQAVEIAAQQQAQKDALDAAQAKSDAAMEQYRSFKMRDFWRDLDGGKSNGPERVKAAIFVALGAFNSDHHGGENTSLTQINTMIDQQHRADMAELNKRGKFAEWAREGVQDLAGRYKEEMANLKLKQSAMTNAVADEAKAQLIRNGIPVLEAENNTLVAGLRAKAEDAYAKGLEAHAHNAATEAMARAHLQIARQNANTTAAMAGASIAEKNAKQNAKSRVGDVYGPNGEVIGNLATGDDTLDRKRSEDMTKSTGVYTALRETLKALDESVKNEGTGRPSVNVLGVTIPASELGAKREALHSQALLQLKTLGELGVLAGPDMGIMEQGMGSVSGNAIGMDSKKIPTLISVLDRNMAKKMSANGLDGPRTLPKLWAAQPGQDGKAESAPSAGGIPDGATGRAKDGTPVVRRGGKWVAQ